MRLLREKGRMQEEINRLENVQPKRNSVMPVSGRRGKAHPINRLGTNRRTRGRNFDVVEYAAKRGLFGSNMINPIFVIKAQLLNIEKPML
jgi:hypothetical protein